MIAQSAFNFPLDTLPEKLFIIKISSISRKWEQTIGTVAGKRCFNSMLEVSSFLKYFRNFDGIGSSKV